MLKDLFLSIGFVALITGTASLFAGKTIFAKLIRLIGGVLTLLILFNAFTGGGDLAGLLRRFSGEMELSQKTAGQEAQKLIQRSYDAYISSRAAEIGLDCGARVVFDPDNNPVRCEVYYKGRPDISLVNELMSIINDELGISPEAQRHAIEGL